MSAASQARTGTELSEKQRRIVEYLRDHDEQTYFKSRLVGEELGLSAKEVGANMQAIAGTADFTIEKWGYSSATTWKVTDRN
ncbi:MAG: hypothetical protein ABEJ35_00250 [Halobacteriaceae archaeon]